MSNQNFPLTVFVILLLTALLVACTTSENQAVQAVEAYLQALVEKDQDRLLASICPAWEIDALLELDALSLIETSLSDLSCEFTSGEKDQGSVICQGSINATYGTEIQQFDLGHRSFLVVKSGSDWLVCGYK